MNDQVIDMHWQTRLLSPACVGNRTHGPLVSIHLAHNDQHFNRLSRLAALKKDSSLVRVIVLFAVYPAVYRVYTAKTGNAFRTHVEHIQNTTGT